MMQLAIKKQKIYRATEKMDGKRHRLHDGQRDPELLDEDQQRSIVENLEAEAANAIRKETCSLALFCCILAFVAVGLAVCEVMWPWSSSLPHLTLHGKLPHWGVVVTHIFACLAHLSSLLVILPERKQRLCSVDFVALSFFLSFGTATVWLTALLLSGHFWSWPILLVVKNPATCLLAWDSARDSTEVNRSILNLKRSVYKFKVV